ncbi:MAG: hypothetical protein J7K68_01390 [Candidatus Diapherotrites archaeon]|nr:hypothetical protein [Candidatus Diapherotrites archaeon]
MLKELINSMVDAVEDLATAIIAVVLVIFVAGEFYANMFPATTQEFWYPSALFVVVLILKLIKDIFQKVRRKK